MRQLKASTRRLCSSTAQQLSQCRRQTWPQSQAIWLRLYPCDALDGVVEELLDRIVSRGYNEVYLEVFYNGQVLLPAAQNPTAWPAVIRTPGQEGRSAGADDCAGAPAGAEGLCLDVYAELWLYLQPAVRV